MPIAMDYDTDKLDRAKSLVEKFGRTPREARETVARVCGVTPHAVWRWLTPESRGGYGGSIKDDHVRSLWHYAGENGISLDPARERLPAPIYVLSELHRAEMSESV